MVIYSYPSSSTANQEAEEEEEDDEEEEEEEIWRSALPLGGPYPGRA